uniref:Uncharacterized protein n=1 Tax=viral metagenome TaxID=1070528 RepID=A0A6C0E2M5_9ZZZZ
MEQIRINEKNNIRLKIKETNSQINKNTETIKRLRNIQDNVEFYKKQIDKLNTKIKEDESNLIDLEKKLEDVTNGLYDLTLNENISKNNVIAQNKQDISDKKNKIKNEQKREDKKNLDLEYKTFRKHDGISSFGLQKETDRFFFNCDTIPDYIKENLKTMPNNKGYIWKGIQCFGELPPENDTIILFEKLRGNIMKIHEISRKQYLIYEKQGKGQKKLISNEKRNPILSNAQIEKLKLMAK